MPAAFATGFTAPGALVGKIPLRQFVNDPLKNRSLLIAPANVFIRSALHTNKMAAYLQLKIDYRTPGNVSFFVIIFFHDFFPRLRPLPGFWRIRPGAENKFWIRIITSPWGFQLARPNADFMSQK